MADLPPTVRADGTLLERQLVAESEEPLIVLASGPDIILRTGCGRLDITLPGWVAVGLGNTIAEAGWDAVLRQQQQEGGR